MNEWPSANTDHNSLYASHSFKNGLVSERTSVVVYNVIDTCNIYATNVTLCNATSPIFYLSSDLQIPPGMLEGAWEGASRSTIWSGFKKSIIKPWGLFFSMHPWGNSQSTSSCILMVENPDLSLDILCIDRNRDNGWEFNPSLFSRGLISPVLLCKLC